MPGVTAAILPPEDHTWGGKASTEEAERKHDGGGGEGGASGHGEPLRQTFSFLPMGFLIINKGPSSLNH